MELADLLNHVVGGVGKKHQLLIRPGWIRPTWIRPTWIRPAGGGLTVGGPVALEFSQQLLRQ